MTAQYMAKWVAHEARFSNGASVNYLGYVPADGFMVGGEVPEYVINPASGLESAIRSYVLNHWDKLAADPELYMGCWRNPDNGHIHLDLSQRLFGRTEALELARERGELAFYDLSTRRTIPVHYNTVKHG